MFINSNIIRALRPIQWIKNLLIFSALIFSGQLLNANCFFYTVYAFVAFSFLVSAIYLINDLIDLKSDVFHPVKKYRPLADGQITFMQTASVSFVLMLIAFIAGYFIKLEFFWLMLAYFSLNVLYAKYLKHIVILDVLSLSCFFVMRVVAGALVIGVSASHWLIICTFMLAAFIGFGKRRHELIILKEDAAKHRKVLKYYDAYLLDQMIAVLTASTLITFILYTVSAESIENFGSVKLLYTTPFVLYGIFRYLYLIHSKDKGGDPAVLVLKDSPMFFNVVGWGISVVLLIYLF